MPTLAQTHAGKVVSLWGKALIRGADGKMRALQVGDMVQRGDVILTSQDGIVQVAPHEEPRRQAAVPGGNEVDRVIAELENNEPTAATTATTGGDGGGSMGPGLRVDRIVETVSYAANLQSGGYASSRVQEETRDLRSLSAPHLGQNEPASPAPAVDTEPAAPPAASAITTHTSIAATEEGPAVGLKLAAADGTVIQIREVPDIGEIRTAQGRLVSVGDTLSAEDLAGLRYVPPSDHDGHTPAGELVYTVSQDGLVIENGTTRIDLTATNDAPVAQAGSAAGLEDQTLPIALGGADVDGQVAGVTIVFIPEGSRLWLGDGSTPVTAGQTLTPAQAAQLLFQPANDFHGDAGITYTVTDDAGQVSATATFGLVITSVNDAPVVRADAALTPINTAVTIDVLSNDRDPDGDALNVSTAELADPFLGSVSVNPDGTLHFTPAANVSGPVEIQYVVSDGQGGAATSVVTVQVGGNTPPEGTDRTVSLDEDSSRALLVSDFGFADGDAGQGLAHVRIDTLPAAGALLLDGGTVMAGQVVSVADVAAGRLVFVPEPDAHASDYASLTFSVQDSAGAFDPVPNTLTFDVRSMADAATVRGQSAGGVIEDSLTTVTGTLSVSDPDAGEAAFVAQAEVPGAHGRFSIDASGAWRYTLDNDDPAVQALAEGDNLPAEVFTVATIDGTARQITVTITGSNDAAVLSAGTTQLSETDVPLSTGGMLTIADVDSPATFVPQSGTAGSHGMFYIDAGGTWTYTASSAHVGIAAVSTTI